MKEHAPDSLAKELKRKVFHLATLLYLLAYLELGYPLTLYLMAGWMGLITLVETARLISPAVRSFLHNIFAPIMRHKEERRYTGAFYTSLGAFLTFYFFGERPAIVNAALLYLALGDAAAAIIGKRWGRHPYAIWGSTKTLEGSLAGMTVAVLCGLALGMPAKLVAGGAAAFCVADAVPFPPDDNLWIPVLTGAALRCLGA